LIPIIICVSFIVYALVDLAPGNVVDAMINENMTYDDIDALMRLYDLDKPMIYRYGKYMYNLLQGDLGVSLTSGLSIWDTFMERLPNTLILSFSGLIIGLSCAIPLGIVAAKRAGSVIDSTVTVVAVIGVSLPVFWLALLLLQLFSQKLGWFPAGGMSRGLRSLILPAVCCGLMLMATATRQTRSSLLELLKADFLRTARAKGVPEGTVIRRHALGNAWIPIVTVVGSSLAHSIANSVIIEQVFAWPGIGRMATEGVLARDTPTVLGAVMMTTVFYVMIQILVDIIYAFVDPKIKSLYVTSQKKKR